MAGLYIHVPFCKKKCLYCDFYSIGTTSKVSQFPKLIGKELSIRKNFIACEQIDTIYFGGGTPSQLSPSQLAYIINCITKEYSVSADSEITIEANPDDISTKFLQGYRSAGVNRVSIGVQSFIDDELRFLGRRHDAMAAEHSIHLALNNGFENISIDLIYGIPNSTLSSWEFSLKKAFSLDIKHLSCYHLTYETGTLLTRRLNDKQIVEVDESISVQQFNILHELAQRNGFTHYEVSNLAKERFFSRHNTAYWKGTHYLGLGPSAHSYNGITREWNPNSYIEWERGVESEKLTLQSEILDERTKFNETLLTHLRAIWGVNLIELRNDFDSRMADLLLINAKKHLMTNRLKIVENHLIIPPKYFFISDGIIGDLMQVDDLHLS